jgi:hypothetical protein
MAKGTKAAVRAVQQKGLKALAWVSFGLAVVGGTLATQTFMGKFVQGFLGLWPWKWIPPVLLAGGVIALGVDIFIDLVPNRAAIWSALLLPSVAASVPQKLGFEVRHACQAVLDQINGWLHVWITDSATGLAIVCCGSALIMARRVLHKSRAAGVA